MDYNKIDKYILKYLLLILIGVFLLTNSTLVFGLVHKVLLSFNTIFIACLLAFVLNIIMKNYIKLFKVTKVELLIKYSIPISLLCTFLTIWFIFTSLFRLVIPELINATNLLFEVLPSYIEELITYAIAFFKDVPEVSSALSAINIDWKAMLDNILNFLSSGFGNVLNTTVNITLSVFGSLFNGLLAVVFAIYLLLEKTRIKSTIHRLATLYIKPTTYKLLHHTYSITSHTFSAFIAGQCVEAVILGALCTLGMTIFGMPYALMVGTLVGTINIIPIVGAYVGGAIGAFMVFTVNPMLAVGFIVYLIILQQIESNLIYPRVVGSSVGLPGIYVLGSVIVFGSLAGVPGMFLGIPFVASIYKLSKSYIAYKESLIR